MKKTILFIYLMKLSNLVYAVLLIWEPRIGNTLSALTGGKEEVVEINLSFVFSFNGTTYNKIYVGASGSVQFGGLSQDQGISGIYYNYMDNFTADGALSIAACSSNYDLFDNGTVYFNDMGNKAFFTWNEIGSFQDENALSSFQLQLFSSDVIYISMNGILDGSNEDIIKDLGGVLLLELPRVA